MRSPGIFSSHLTMHASKWTGYTKFPQGVNECGALQWTGWLKDTQYREWMGGWMEQAVPYVAPCRPHLQMIYMTTFLSPLNKQLLVSCIIEKMQH